MVVGGDGWDAGCMIDDQEPQFGCSSLLAGHAVVIATVAPAATWLVHAAGGSCNVPPDTVQSVPWVNTTQQAAEPQTPLPPAGNCNATLTFTGSTPAGSEIAQLAVSTATTVPVAKQSCTSKHPAAVPPSAAVAAIVPPAPPAPMGYVGNDATGTLEVRQAPCTHVNPAGHVETTVPSAWTAAVPSHR